MTLKIKQRIDQIRHGEVPDGYKKTKFGIIPNEWEIHTLSKHLVESRIPGTNGAIAKKLTVKLWNKGVFEKCEIHEGSENTTYYKRKKGQLIYSKLDFLNCAFGIIPEYLDGYESTQDLPCFDIENVNSYYLLAYITQRNFYIRFGMIADGGRKARRVGPEDMLSFPLIFPPLAEQEKIAEILQTQDKLIALQQKKIDELKRLKKVYLSKMFPKKGCDVPEIRFSEFTDPWEQRKFSELYEKVSRKNDMSYGKDDIISVANMYYKADSYITDERYLLTYNIFELGDIAFEGNKNKSFSHGRFVENTIGNGIVSHVFDVFKPIMSPYDLMFWKYAINNEQLMGGILLRSTKASTMMTNLVASDFLQESFLVPSYEEQTKIGGFFDNLDNHITLHQHKLEEEQKKKKALMQLLLTGIIRVEVK